jgi:hypothetical protein
MALTARQRNRLPAAAFIDRANRRFPAPTKAQARTAGISEAQRLRTLRSALSRAGQQAGHAASIRRRRVRKVTPTAARSIVRARAGGAIASVKPATTRRRTTTTRRRRRRTTRRRTRR